MTDIKLLDEPLDIAACINTVRSPDAGGIDVFIGTVRNQTKGRTVVRLEFEAYEAMALKTMQAIVGEAMERWPLHHVVLHHRKGILQVGEVPVVIAVAAAHRAAAFEACRFIIDTLKEKVPIWKKEIFEDGSSWVAAHP